MPSVLPFQRYRFGKRLVIVGRMQSTDFPPVWPPRQTVSVCTWILLRRGEAADLARRDCGCIVGPLNRGGRVPRRPKKARKVNPIG
jgi:hypothetical protein